MDAPITPPPTEPRAWGVLFMLFAFQTLNFFDKLVFGLSAAPIMRELHLGPRQFGLLGSAFFLLFSLSGTLVGLFLTGRIRTKWILVALALIWSASQLPVILTTSFAWFLFARILLGAGEGPGLPSALNASYDWFPPERRSIPSAIILQGISAGFLIGGPVLTAIILHWGWRRGFAVCGMLGLVWAAVWSMVSREGPLATNARTPHAGARLPGRMLWLDGTVIGTMLMSTASYYVVGMSANWLPLYLQQGLHYTPTRAGWIISAVFAFQSPLLLGGSWLCQRLQRRGWSGRAALGHACTLALLVPGLALIAATRSAGGLQLVFIALGFAVPTLTTVYGAVLLALIAPPAQRGRLVVVIYSANALAGAVSTFATGWIVGAAPVREAGFVNAIMVAGVVLLAGAVASFALLHPERTARRFSQARPEALPLDPASGIALGTR